MKSVTGATNQHNALEAHECPVSLLSGFVPWVHRPFLLLALCRFAPVRLFLSSYAHQQATAAVSDASGRW
ncbi:hypothetical protein DEU52_1673 [Ensifer adhaerens]|nr:hypothetical protein DEU52_1673 [Ensifer adhaerens]